MKIHDRGVCIRDSDPFFFLNPSSVKKKSGPGQYQTGSQILTLRGYSLRLQNFEICYITGCSLNIVFFTNFLNYSELCLPSVSVCVHTPARQKTSTAAELAEFRKITTFEEKNTIFNEHPVSSVYYKSSMIIQ